MNASSATTCQAFSETLPECGRSIVGPLAERPREALLVAEFNGKGDLFDGARSATQQLNGVLAPHTQLLQRRAFVRQVPMQGANRDVEGAGQRVCCPELYGFGAQQIAHAVHQQSVASVLKDDKRQRMLHAVKRPPAKPR